MARQQYTPELRAEVIADAVALGPAEASRLHGIPKGTIGAWCSRAGLATIASETMRAASDQLKLTHEVRRNALAERLLAEAEQAVEIEIEKLKDAKLYEVVGARTRAIHDHQLLTGQATARTETSDTRTAAEGTLDELAKRRATKAA